MFHPKCLGFYIFICMGLLSCQKKPIVPFEKPYDGPLMTAYDIETLYSDSAIVKVRLNAKVQYEYFNGDRRFPKGIKIEFFKKNGEINSVLTANEGFYYKQTDNYKVIGNVEIQNQVENKKLNTEELLWEPGLKKVSTDKFVRIQTPKEILMGIGLTASQDFKYYKILKPTGVFSINSGK